MTRAPAPTDWGRRILLEKAEKEGLTLALFTHQISTCLDSGCIFGARTRTPYMVLLHALRAGSGEQALVHSAGAHVRAIYEVSSAGLLPYLACASWLACPGCWSRPGMRMLVCGRSLTGRPLRGSFKIPGLLLLSCMESSLRLPASLYLVFSRTSAALALLHAYIAM